MHWGGFMGFGLKEQTKKKKSEKTQKQKTKKKTKKKIIQKEENQTPENKQKKKIRAWKREVFGRFQGGSSEKPLG